MAVLLLSKFNYLFNQHPFVINRSTALQILTL